MTACMENGRMRFSILLLAGHRDAGRASRLPHKEGQRNDEPDAFIPFDSAIEQA